MLDLDTFIKKLVLPWVVLVILVGCSIQNNKVHASYKMKTLIANISKTAKNQNPNFLVVPQNGLDLFFKDIDVTKGIDTDYISHIDGVGVEVLFSNKSFQPDYYRIQLVDSITKFGVPIMNADYLDSISRINLDSLHQNHRVLSYPRQKDNFHYSEVQPLSQSSQESVHTLAQAKNFMYLLNAKNYNTKEAYLGALSATNYDMILIDLFFHDEPLTYEDVATLKFKNNGAKRVVMCYMNTGAIETFRYYWQKKWNKKQPSFVLNAYIGYDDEYWVAFWDKKWRTILYDSPDSYLQKILTAGFDGVFLDNVEAYYFIYEN